jgi:hypothetical protein
LRRGPRALVVSDSVFLHTVKWLVGVQQHCGGGSCTAVALFGAVVPSLWSLPVADPSDGFDTYRSAGGSCCRALSSLSTL